jgi:hypothetical protein
VRADSRRMQGFGHQPCFDLAGAAGRQPHHGGGITGDQLILGDGVREPARSVSRASRQLCGDKTSPQQRPNAQRGTQPPVHPTTVASIAILGFIGTGIAYVLTCQIIIGEGATIASTVTYCRRWSPSSSASWS